MMIVNWLEYALALVVVLGILIFVHELGHFLAAKYFRVRVETFSLGFGPRLFGFRRGDTDYRISAIPLGGYVRMTGEMDEIGRSEEDSGRPDSLTTKPRWQRLVIMLAGPTMNIALAMLIWWGLFMHGTETLDIPEGPPYVESVLPGSPAEQAGVAPGDRIVKVDGEAIDSVEEYTERLLFRPGRTVTYTVLRGEQELPREVTIGTHPVYGVGTDGVRVRMPVLIGSVAPDSPAERAGLKAGDRLVEINGRVAAGIDSVQKVIEQSAGKSVQLEVERAGQLVELAVEPAAIDGSRPRIGVTLTFPNKFVRFGPLQAAGESARMAWRNADLLFRTLSALVRRQVGMSVMSGPLEIARISREQASQGVVAFLQLLALISIQLGIFNLLPIPVLDGGHVLILLFESVIRRDLSLRLKERVLQAGFLLLVLFAVTVIALDVRKAFQRLPDTPPAATQPAD
ncbi:MAG: RIP metalloprotease RseP [Acidobacteria bacterium]|nr:RIP metalloprotease RseP [Acidobacteriota bacterium]